MYTIDISLMVPSLPDVQMDHIIENSPGGYGPEQSYNADLNRNRD